MNKLFSLLVLSFFVLATNRALGQDKVLEVRGRLIDNAAKPIQFAHVINFKKGIACISDTAGRFRILMLKTDTVRVSCIGFETLKFSLSGKNIDQFQDTVYLGDIKLITKVYDLETVNVFRERWNSFVYDYQQIEVEDKPYYVKQIENWKQNLISVEQLRQLTTAANGSGFAFSLNNKRAKAIRRLNELKRQDELNKLADEKYNPDIVANITGMTVEDAQAFIRHFNLDRDFILRKNDYDLYLIIKQLYQDYNKNK